HGEMLATLAEDVESLRPVLDILSSLSDMKFVVPQELSGAMLENERNRISDMILNILKGLSKQRAVLVTLEDLHWADDSSLFVLNYLARNIVAERIMILGTMRQDESVLLSAQLGRMRAEGLINELALGALAPDAVATIVGDLYPINDFPTDFIIILSENCAGNPFFITELLKHMSVDGHIAENGGKYTLVSENYAIPTAVGDFVNRKLEGIEPDVMSLLEYASCIGIRFDVNILTAYDAAANNQQTIERLCRTGILTVPSGAAEFSHAIFRDAIYQGIGDRWKAIHHQRIGEYYEYEFCDRQSEVLYELARHFFMSNEHAKAFDYCSRAGEKAESEYAPLQALELYNQALSALGRTGKRTDALSSARLMEKMGDMQSLLGRHDEALANYVGAGAQYEQRTDKARMLRKDGEITSKKGDYGAALKMYAEATGLMGDDHGIEYGKIRLLEGDLYIRTGDRAKAVELLEEAHCVFADTGFDLREISNALKQIGTLHFKMGNYDEAMQYLQQSHEFAKSTGDLVGITNALNNIALVYFEKDEFDLAIDFLNESLKMREKMGDISTMPNSLSNLGTAYYLKGEFDLALDCHRRALAMKERFGQKWGIANSNLSIGLILFARGELEQAMERYEKSRMIWEGMGDRQGLVSALINIAELHLFKGEFSQAMDTYSRSLSIAEEIGKELSASTALCGLAQISLETGNAESALSSAKRALTIAENAKSNSSKGKCIRVLGTVYRAMNEHDKAEKALVKSIRLLGECSDRSAVLYSYYEYGLLLKAMGRLDEARQNLQKSHEQFSAMGIRLWEKKALEALDGL
ncbi:MAG: tetratricopeptide repeat protein, partial [Thermoplasmata archaeon]|nr:tetratricopeptide repeat protein [Thermoplasmata archaeon]